MQNSWAAQLRIAPSNECYFDMVAKKKVRTDQHILCANGNFSNFANRIHEKMDIFASARLLNFLTDYTSQ